MLGKHARRDDEHTEFGTLLCLFCRLHGICPHHVDFHELLAHSHMVMSRMSPVRSVPDVPDVPSAVRGHAI